MRAAVIHKARWEREARRKVQAAFNVYLDYIIERLVAKGVSDTDAMEAVFYTADFLTEKGQLPPFPETGNYRDMGAWVVAAADFGFIDFMVDAV